jgi:hypothetical protein
VDPPLLMFVPMAMQPGYHQQLVLFTTFTQPPKGSLLGKRHNNGGDDAGDRSE